MIGSTPIAPAADPEAQDADDLALLRQYEPILRFTHGEMFFPMPAERYLESAALKLEESALPAAHLRAISHENARRLLPKA